MKNSSTVSRFLLLMGQQLPEPSVNSSTLGGNEKNEEQSPQLMLLLLLLLLLIPGVWGLYHLIRCCRRYRYHQLSRRLKLSGSLRPGDVDDAEMGRVILGGDWLTDRGRSRSGETGNMVHFLDTSTPSMEFDPILEEAEKYKRRWIRRRNLTDADNSNSNILHNDNVKSNINDNSASVISAEIENIFEEDVMGTSVGDTSPERVEDSVGAGMRLGRRNTIVGVAGTLDVTTTRVWLKKLVSEEENNADDNKYAGDADPSQSGSGGVTGAASAGGMGSGDSRQARGNSSASLLNNRRDGDRSFQQILAHASTSDDLSSGFRMVKLTQGGPVFDSYLDTKEKSIEGGDAEDEAREVSQKEEEEEEYDNDDDANDDDDVTG